MSAELLAGQADITDYADQSPPGDKNSKAVGPDACELEDELLVVLDVPQLARVFVVPLERPIRGRCDDEVD
jgi:hypothetical protein